jgi:hypothetical protein
VREWGQLMFQRFRQGIPRNAGGNKVRKVKLADWASEFLDSQVVVFRGCTSLLATFKTVIVQWRFGLFPVGLIKQLECLLVALVLCHFIVEIAGGFGVGKVDDGLHAVEAKFLSFLNLVPATQSMHPVTYLRTTLIL